MVTLAQLVQPAPLAPPAVSLVRAAASPADTTDGRWAIGGITYTPETSVEAGLDAACGPASGSYTATMPASVEWVPYGVTVLDVCSAMSGGGRDYAGRARRLLDAATPKAVEKEFWGGAYAQSASLPNLYLTKAGSTVVNPTPGTSVSFARGVRLLEQALADLGFGAPGMIHCRPEAVDDFEVQLRREGNLIRTLRDTIVVPGVGYSGLGPAGDSNATPAAGKSWMFATGLVDYRQTTADVPDWTAGGDPPADVVNRTNNTITVHAWRTALASWDGQARFAVYVDLPA